MDKLLVVVISSVLVGLIVWWFFGNKHYDVVDSVQVDSVQTATITVDGGYSPAVLSLKVGVPAEITFIRKDPSGCLEEIIMPDFGIAVKLPVNQPHVVSFTPQRTGEFTYTCGMRMFSAKVRVV